MKKKNFMYEYLGEIKNVYVMELPQKRSAPGEHLKRFLSAYETPFSAWRHRVMLTPVYKKKAQKSNIYSANGSSFCQASRLPCRPRWLGQGQDGQFS